MSIQSAINQILGSVESLARFKRIDQPIIKALGPRESNPMREKLISEIKAGPEERKARLVASVEHGTEAGRERIAQNVEDMLAYEEQQRAKAYESDAIQSLENRTAEIGNIKQEHKKRREYLRKPHVVNKHGVKYVDGVKQEETK